MKQAFDYGSNPPAARHPRSTIYYWKCDRPAAFHGTADGFRRGDCHTELQTVLAEAFPGRAVALRPAGGQGNHITWIATIGAQEYFVRLEDGPEQDDYIEVESRVLADVRARGVPAPEVFHVDASRRRVLFAWQLMEVINCPDLNELHKAGRLDLAGVARDIGRALARWQSVPLEGFGPFDPQTLRRENRLQGFHATYADYFLLRLDAHLQFLVERNFLSAPAGAEFRQAIERHQPLLAIEHGCLVHKDLALWNILGTPERIAAFIDWDDAIAGDPLDDLALLGCFHDGNVLGRVLEGYTAVRPLPAEHRRRFWLHLLRNMLVKAVIRVGAGYFDRSDRFFLIGAGGTGADLRAFTHARLAAALRGLYENQPLETL